MTPDSGDIAHPEECWIEKGRACRQLHLQGLSAEAIQQKTGLEEMQQSVIIQATEVYESLERGKAPKPVLAHFVSTHAAVLHAFHPLNQTQRIHAATLAVAKHLDAVEARSVTEAILAFAGFTHPPEGFTDHSGDAVACQCWLEARAAADVVLRETLIARGLRFAHSAAARDQLTSLLDHSSVSGNQPTA